MSVFLEKNEDLTKRKILSISLKEKTPPLAELEPTTFEIEVQHDRPLRHGGSTFMVKTFSTFIFPVYLYTPPLREFPSLLNFLPVVGC